MIGMLFAITAITAHAVESPNFVIIYADDLGYTQTSVPMMKDRPELAHALHQTPSLEKLGIEEACDFLVRIVPRLYARHHVQASSLERQQRVSAVYQSMTLS